MSNIAVQNASEDTGSITETGVNNIVPITLISLTAALMMIELSNMIDYITFEYTCYFKMSQLIYSLISHDAECCFYSSLATSRATDLLALTNFNGRWTHTFCVQANLPIIMAPLMLRRGLLRILQHRVGQKASSNAFSCAPAALPDGSVLGARRRAALDQQGQYKISHARISSRSSSPH